MRYRIRANGNGEFRVQRQTGWFRWWNLVWSVSGSVARRPDHYRPEHWMWQNSLGIDYGPVVFTDSAAACKALIDMRDADRRESQAHQWTTVLVEKDHD